MIVFPTYLFDFTAMESDIERRTVSGGVSLSGDETTIITDGGGRVFAEFGGPYLDHPRLAASWRALADNLATDAIIVPLGDIRHQFVGDIAVPPGGLPWWTEAEYVAGRVPNATTTASAPLRGTMLSLALAYQPQPIYPGSWLSIRHPTMCHRAYRIRRVVSQTSAAATLQINPPLREAVAAGAVVNLSDPTCTMRLDGEMRSPTDFGFAEGATVRFVEDFRGTYV